MFVFIFAGAGEREDGLVGVVLGVVLGGEGRGANHEVCVKICIWGIPVIRLPSSGPLGALG